MNIKMNSPECNSILYGIDILSHGVASDGDTWYFSEQHQPPLLALPLNRTMTDLGVSAAGSEKHPPSKGVPEFAPLLLLRCL